MGLVALSSEMRHFSSNDDLVMQKQRDAERSTLYRDEL